MVSGPIRSGAAKYAQCEGLHVSGRMSSPSRDISSLQRQQMYVLGAICSVLFSPTRRIAHSEEIHQHRSDGARISQPRASLKSHYMSQLSASMKVTTCPVCMLRYPWNPVCRPSQGPIRVMLNAINLPCFGGPESASHFCNAMPLCWASICIRSHMRPFKSYANSGLTIRPVSI
jgi:hypothetical protein